MRVWEAGTPTPLVHIRLARPDDLPALERIESLAFRHPWSRETLEVELGHPLALVLVACQRRRPACADGAAGRRGRQARGVPPEGVVGYASFRKAAGEAELLRVAVEPETRRRGIGRRLLGEGLTRLGRAGAVACHLEVRADQAAAQALYQSLGFRLTGRRPGYYPDGCDALLYTRRLSSPPPAGLESTDPA